MSVPTAEEYIRCDADEPDCSERQLTPAEIVARHHVKIRQAIDILEQASRQIIDEIDPDTDDWQDVWKVSGHTEGAAYLLELVAEGER